MSIVRSLRAVPDKDLDSNARKLLTFVDNRQDAALQAGHFNDFVEVTMIRGALYRAAVKAVEDGEDGLYHDDIAPKVTRALGLDQGRVRAGPRRGPRPGQADRPGTARGRQPAGLPRPGPGLAGDDAQPGEHRPAGDRLPRPV